MLVNTGPDCVTDHSFYGPLKEHKMITISEAVEGLILPARQDNYSKDVIKLLK